MTAADLITYYDDATGERTGLSAGELGGWAAATAALLTEGCGLGRGDTAAVLLPPHWQTAAVLLGAWSAGLELSIRGWATAGLEPAGDPLDVTFVHRSRIGSWLDDVPPGRYRFALGSAPHDVPDGYLDFATAVRPRLGTPAPQLRPDETLPATVDGTTYQQYASVAAEVAERNGIGPCDRVLVDTAVIEQPVLWLLAPLTVGASIVLCAHLDESRLDERITDERVTKILR